MDEYLVSQRQAVGMLRDVGLSRRAAYYHIAALPSRIVVDAKVYARVDVEVLRERLRRDVEVPHV